MVLLRNSSGVKIRDTAGEIARRIWGEGYGMRIKGYTDGDIPASTCTTIVSGSGTLWNGEMPERAFVNQWLQLDSDSPFPTQIDTKEFVQAQVILSASVWYLTVTIQRTAIQSTTAWLGEKTCNDCMSPCGIYTRTSGCAATPSTLEIEKYTP